MTCTKDMRFWMRYLRIPSRPPIASSTVISNHKQRDFVTDLPLRKQSSSSFFSLSSTTKNFQRHARQSVSKNLPSAMIDTAAYNNNPIHSLDAPIKTAPNWVSWEAEIPTLCQFTDAMNFLYQEHDRHDDESQRQYLCIDVIRLVMSAKASIQQGKIRAMRGKDRYALTDCLGLAMLVYSRTQPTTLGGTTSTNNGALSPYDASIGVIDILRSLNIDILPTHYTCAIRAACNESRWSDATSLLYSQIDGNDNADGISTGGLTPIDANLAWEGLYAVAMKLATANEAEQMKDSPSKVVFDTAMKMCMISPEGQEQYILAAGKALGRAGLWEDCVDFATDSTSITLYGPSIVAAAMLACNACSRFDDTVSVYDYFMSGNRNAAEWQWGGGDVTAIKPMCRNLALYAMGNDEKGGQSKRAMSLFAEIIDEGNPVRSNTLLNLAHSMELDGQWQSSFNLLKAIPSLEIDVSEINTGEKDNLHADILASVMRVCNSGGQHGLAILANIYCNSEHMTNSNSLQISQAIIQSICGLGCGIYANELSNELQTDVPRWSLNKYSSHRESWINAFLAIDRVLKVINEIRLEGNNISSSSHLRFERGLSRAMEHCIDSGQSATALELYFHTNTFLTKRDESLTQRVKALFGMESTKREKLFHLSRIKMKEMTLTDPLLATIIKAYNKLDPRKAHSIFEDGTINLGDSTLVSQSINNALEVILNIDVNEGWRFFKAMDPKCVNPSTFCLVARKYAQRGIWHEIGNVYNRARSAGCVNEDLGLIAMQAVCKSELLEGKIVILRRIVDDVCGLSLMKSNDWIKLHYWTIRKNIGFHYTRVSAQFLLYLLLSLSIQ